MSAKPTQPGFYWYRGDVTGTAVVEVFKGSKYYGGKMICNALGYNYFPSVEELEGEWSLDPVSPPPWGPEELANWSNGADPRAKDNIED